MPKTEDVKLKDGEKAFAGRTKDGYVFTTIEKPILLTSSQARIIIGLLIFIVLILILYLFFNAYFLADIGNRILQEIDNIKNIGTLSYTP